MKSKFKGEPRFACQEMPADPSGGLTLLAILAACSDVNAGTLANSGKRGTSGQLNAAPHPKFSYSEPWVAAPDRGFDSRGTTFLRRTEQRPRGLCSLP